MGPDRQERHDALLSHEQQLTNGKRGDLNAMCDHQVDMSRALRVVLATDFVKPNELEEVLSRYHSTCIKHGELDDYCKRKHKARFGWPAAVTVITIACLIIGTVVAAIN